MKKWILTIALTGTLVCAGQFAEVMPAEMVMMESGADEEVTTLTFGDRNSTGSSQIEEEVISAEEYLGDTQALSSVDLSHFADSKPKIALLVPKKVIGAYANSVANSILSYLLYQQGHFIFEVFDSKTQSKEDLMLTLGKIHQKGFRVIIAPVTPAGANVLAMLEREAFVYVPTVNINDVEVENPNFLYGGIDYQAQIEALLTQANQKIVIFGDKSALAKKLSEYIHQKRLEDIVYVKEIKNAKANLSYLLKKNRRLKDATIFLNMPVVKSALLAAQLSRYKVPYEKILSTQVNYSPLLFTLTQYQDRRKFFIANAISGAPFVLEDINRLIGSDIRYNWINYATSIGMDYLFDSSAGQGEKQLFIEAVMGQQVYYDTHIVRAGQGSFIPVDTLDMSMDQNGE